MKTNNRSWLFLLLTMGVIVILVYSCSKSDEDNNTTSITDKDGNVYTSITIGTQVWMKENLKTTKLNDGTEIPVVTDLTAWHVYRTPACSWYDNDITNKATYGALYNWYAVNSGKLCPTGWHVPSVEERDALKTQAGGEGIAGGRLKEQGTAHWNSPNTGATNETLFTGLPGGRCGASDPYYKFMEMGDFGNWWASTEVDVNGESAYAFFFDKGSSAFWSSKRIKTDGFSVRCLKDN